MTKYLLLFSGLVFTSSALQGQSNLLEDTLIETSLIKDDSKRLVAYDKLAQLLKDSAKSKTMTPTWDVDTEVSPIDDSKSVFITLYSTDKKASLILRHQEGKFEAYITTKKFLGRNTTVTVRIDSHKAVTREWGTSTDRKALFHPKPKLLVNILKKSQKLVVRFAPYNESPTTLVFNTGGLDKIVNKLK